MKVTEIKKRIDAFYRGETTAEEEQALLDYFNSGEVEEELLEEKELFILMYGACPVVVPPDLESKLSNRIDSLAAEERGKAGPKPGRKRIWAWTGGIAAGIALLLSVGVYTAKETKPEPLPVTQEVAGTVTITAEDMQKIKEAQEALVFMSLKFNQGMEQLAVVSANLDKTSEILNKAFNSKKEKEIWN